MVLRQDRHVKIVKMTLTILTVGDPRDDYFRLLLADRACPRPRAALPFAAVDRLPVTFDHASSTRPATLSSVPSALFRRLDFAIRSSFLRR